MVPERVRTPLPDDRSCEEDALEVGRELVDVSSRGEKCVRIAESDCNEVLLLKLANRKRDLPFFK